MAGLNSAAALMLSAERAQFVTVASDNLRLRWASSGIDLAHESLQQRVGTNNGYTLPDLSDNPSLYIPSRKDLGPVSGTLTISDEIFAHIFPDGRWADISFIQNARLAVPTAMNDPWWGIINSPNIMALLRAVDHVRPKETLVIGAGVGLVESLIAQAMPEGSCLTAIDCGSSETRYPITAHGETYRRLISELGLFSFLKIAEQRRLIGEGSSAAYVKTQEIDSQQFLDNALQRLENRYDLILIDGNHAFLNGTLDILKAFTLLNEKGLLFIDDWNRLYHSQGVVHGAGLLAYHCGVQVYSLESKGNKILVDNAGNPPNMVFASNHRDGRRPVDPAVGAEIPALLTRIRSMTSW